MINLDMILWWINYWGENGAHRFFMQKKRWNSAECPWNERWTGSRKPIPRKTGSTLEGRNLPELQRQSKRLGTRSANIHVNQCRRWLRSKGCCQEGWNGWSLAIYGCVRSRSNQTAAWRNNKDQTAGMGHSPTRELSWRHWATSSSAMSC